MRDPHTKGGSSIPVWLQGVWLAGIAGALFVLYHLQGNSTYTEGYSRSAFRWMTALWAYEGYDFSHGWLIPLVSLFVVWTRRRELTAAPRCLYWPGVCVVVFALGLHVVGLRIQQTRLSLLSFILLLWGLPLFFAGPRFSRHLLFACGYLVFCIPFTFLDSLTFPLRLISASVSTVLLNGVGVETVRRGTSLHFPGAAGFPLDVADPCSGLKYFLALTALAAAYAYLCQKGQVKRCLLFAVSVPVAIAGNVVRITGIALVARLFGTDAALGLYHDWSGLIVFTAALSLLFGIQTLLNLDYRKKLAQWRRSPA